MSRSRNRKKGKVESSLVGQGYGDIFDKYGNMGVGADGNRYASAIGRGAQFSNTQLAEMQFNHDEAQADRQFQEEMYNKYQSPEAQMRQYQAAGLNPALMYQGGVDINGPSGGSAASASGAVGGDTPQSGFEMVMGVMSQLMSVFTGSSQIASQVTSNINDTKVANATADEKKANADNLRAKTEGQKLDNELVSTFGFIERSYNIESQRANIEKTYQDIRESASRISVNDSVIELNGEKIQLCKSEAGLNAAKTLLTNFELKKGQAMLQPTLNLLRAQSSYYYSQGSFLDAQTEEVAANASAQRAQQYASALYSTLQACVTQGLLDNGYCETFVNYYKDQGDAALITAYSNWRNANTNERNAAVNERNAAVNERNAAVNEENAKSNKMNAYTNRIKVASDMAFQVLSLLPNAIMATVPASGTLPMLPMP